MKALQKISVLLLALTICWGLTLNVSAATVGKYQVYLGGAVASDSQDLGVWQSASALNEGASSVYYAYESLNGNKFLRLANFNSTVYSSYTTVNLALDYHAQWKSVVTVRFDYRLSEGSDAYLSDEKVATISVGGVQRHLTYGDLTCTSQGSYDWQSYSVTLSVGQQDKADRVVFTYYYDGAEKTADTSRFMDLDNVEITSGTTSLGSHDIQFASVSAADKLAFSFDSTTENISNKNALMLFDSDALNYSENTLYNQTQVAVFGGADAAAAVPHTGEFIYRGASSVKAGESDLYVLYDVAEGNSFLRLANYNGTAGTTSSRFSMTFYNSKARTVENMPATCRINYSFKYRLYADDEILNTLDLSENVLQFSTRSSSDNNSGFISFDELVINEPGDETWHTFNGVLEVLTTTTAYVTIYYYGYESASLAPHIYLDVDDITLSPQGSDVNYAYLDGGFEGMVPTVSGGDDPLNSQVFNNPVLGAVGEKIRTTANNFAMELEKNESFSISLGWTPKTDVYHVSFKTVCESGSIRLYFGGRSGKYVDITVGKNSGRMGDDLSVYWSKTEYGYDCNLYFARLVNTDIYSIDFVNKGSAAVVIDDVFVGEVKSVNYLNGDYQSYISQLEALRAEYQANMGSYKSSTVKLVEQALFNADRITRYSSDERMQSALKSVSDLLNDATQKPDMTELNAAIERAEKLYENGGAALYSRSTWILFEKALLNARNLTEESGQTKVNDACAELEAAMRNLVTVANESGISTTAKIALSIGGVGSAGLITAFTVRRRRKNEE